MRVGIEQKILDNNNIKTALEGTNFTSWRLGVHIEKARARYDIASRAASWEILFFQFHTLLLRTL